MASLRELHNLGQSTWLNYLRNSVIRSGKLAQWIDWGVQGVTANAQVYERAIAGSNDYDAAILRAMAEGKSAGSTQELLMVDDIQRAADVLHPVFESTNRRDGFVSFELDPSRLGDVTNAVAEVRLITHHIDRPNVMVEIPATPVGIDAIRTLTADGVSVNATHLSSIAVYEKIAAAYIEGLAEYISSHSVWRTTPTAVASFSLNPLDMAVDEWLDEAGRPDLRGKTAIALAKVLYARYRKLFSGPAWEKMTAKNARPLRLKWTRATPRDFLYDETHYINELVGPDTIITLSPLMLTAFLNRGSVGETISRGLDAAEAHLAELNALGLDLEKLSAKIQRKRLMTSDRSFQSLVHTVIKKRDELETGWRPLTEKLGAAQNIFDEGLQDLCRNQIVCRIWSHDHTVWKSQPTEITNRLGWLTIMDAMAERTEAMTRFAAGLVNEGYTHALLLGMGGSSLAPDLFQNSFGKETYPRNIPYPFLELVVVDTTDADAIRAAEAAVDLARTLVIVSTKSGGTVETLSAFKYFYNKLLDQVGQEEVGRHFIGITDPGSKIVEMGQRYAFRNLFINDPNIGGRYSALSYFGLVPAALIGVDLAKLLERAANAASNATPCDCEAIEGNYAARLGVALGRLALAGHDKVTFITSDALASFGDWVEQLIAESIGKEGKGILPVVGEPLAPVETYGRDRLFIHMRLEGDRGHDPFVDTLAEAGHPVITLKLKDTYDIGGQFVLWEMATAIAGYFLGINPFDQPNVEAAKIKAREIVAEYAAKGSLPPGDFTEVTPQALTAFLQKGKPSDYVSIHAYVRPTPETDEALQSLRQTIHLRTGLATTVGYGPRFLHSTGQLHKGDQGNGLFIQLISDAIEDIAIPDEAGANSSSMSFNVLKKAQALGDARALLDGHRRLITFDVGQNAADSIAELASMI